MSMGAIIGFEPTAVRTSTEGPAFKLGTIAWEGDVPAVPSSAMGVTGGSGGSDEGAKAYMYVKAGSGAVTGAGYVTVIDGSTFVADMVTDTLSAPGTGQGKSVGVGVAAIAASGYGWVQIYGASSVRVLANAAAYTQLTTSATAGCLDDATTAGLEVVDGCTLDAANGGSTANAAAWLNFPYIGRTL